MNRKDIMASRIERSRKFRTFLVNYPNNIKLRRNMNEACRCTCPEEVAPFQGPADYTWIYSAIMHEAKFRLETFYSHNACGFRTRQNLAGLPVKLCAIVVIAGSTIPHKESRPSIRESTTALSSSASTITSDPIYLI